MKVAITQVLDQELAIAVGQVTPEDLASPEFQDAKARIGARMEHLKMGYPQG